MSICPVNIYFGWHFIVTSKVDKVHKLIKEEKAS